MDGTGLREIEDKAVAARLRTKVNDFNLKSSVRAAALAGGFGVICAVFQ